MAIRHKGHSDRAEPSIDAEIDPGTDGTLLLGNGRDPGRNRPRKSPIVLLVLLMILAAGAVFFYLWRQNATQPTSLVTPPPAPPAAAAEVAPAIRHPIDDARSALPPYSETKPLPALMVSDATMQNTLAELFGPASLGKVFFEDAIIHRFVSTVDNLPRKAVPSRNLPVKPIAGPMLTATLDGKVSISADNASRYTPYVRIADAIDAKSLVAAYVHFYPLLQQDYRDLGYPKGYFNDRLIDALDDLLQAPESQDPPELVQPKVLYQYADPALEARSAGQKIMVRMGRENAARMKAKLREIRRELIGAKDGVPAAARQP